jgi:hypothetical protein
MSLERDVLIANDYVADRYGWSDGNCKRRSASLVPNDRPDGGGTNGGYLRELTWFSGATQVTGKGTGVNGWNGWGYVVNHSGAPASTSKSRTGDYRTLLSGQHHAIHEFTVTTQPPSGPLAVTIHWFFATGRSHPVIAITFDSRGAGKDAHTLDTRAPYGDFAFEGGSGNTSIGGIGWGDKYRFQTTGTGPLTPNSNWDYTQPNAVPHVRMWTQGVDAEMGAVQTQLFERQVAGGDYILDQEVRTTNCWGKTGDNAPGCATGGQKMPHGVVWPFQLNQYEYEFVSNSHRIAWGSTFGAVGQSQVSAFGKSFSGYPFFSYSLFTVIDRHSVNPVLAQAQAVEHLAGAQLTASLGTVATQGPGGVGRTDAVTYQPAGYNSVYGVWEVQTQSGAATVTLAPNAGAISMPVFHFTGRGSLPAQVTLNGEALTPNVHYFATADSAAGALWLTLNGTVKGEATLHIE